MKTYQVQIVPSNRNGEPNWLNATTISVLASSLSNAVRKAAPFLKFEQEIKPGLIVAKNGCFINS